MSQKIATVNWNAPFINWQQLGSTQIGRLVDTWGKDEAFVRKYDAKHGFQHLPLEGAVPTKKERAATVAKAMVAKGVIKAPATKAVAKAPVRQKHTGADGEIKFVEHRNLFVGFMGGKVVVTKRTAEACKEVLRKEFNIEV
jgi:hypothetical protein